MAIPSENDSTYSNLYFYTASVTSSSQEDIIGGDGLVGIPYLIIASAQFHNFDIKP